jgi:hypothetical protein
MGRRGVAPLHPRGAVERNFAEVEPVASTRAPVARAAERLGRRALSCALRGGALRRRYDARLLALRASSRCPLGIARGLDGTNVDTARSMCSKHLEHYPDERKHDDPNPNIGLP